MSLKRSLVDAWAAVSLLAYVGAMFTELTLAPPWVAMLPQARSIDYVLSAVATSFWLWMLVDFGILGSEGLKPFIRGLRIWVLAAFPFAPWIYYVLDRRGPRPQESALLPKPEDSAQGDV